MDGRALEGLKNSGPSQTSLEPIGGPIDGTKSESIPLPSDVSSAALSRTPRSQWPLIVQLIGLTEFCVFLKATTCRSEPPLEGSVDEALHLGSPWLSPWANFPFISVSGKKY